MKIVDIAARTLHMSIKGGKKTHLLKVIIKHGRRTEGGGGVRSRRGGSQHYGGGTERQLLVHQLQSTTSLRSHDRDMRQRKAPLCCECVNVVAGRDHSHMWR